MKSQWQCIVSFFFLHKYDILWYNVPHFHHKCHLKHFNLLSNCLWQRMWKFYGNCNKQRGASESIYECIHNFFCCVCLSHFQKREREWLGTGIHVPPYLQHPYNLQQYFSLQFMEKELNIEHSDIGIRQIGTHTHTHVDCNEILCARCIWCSRLLLLLHLVFNRTEGILLQFLIVELSSISIGSQ